MNHNMILRIALILACAAGLLLAQQQAGQAPARSSGQPAAQAASTTPVAKQPAPKSPEEAAAFGEVTKALQSGDNNARIKACDDFQQKYPNSELRPLALYFMTLIYQGQNDYAKTVTYGEATLKADPANYQVMLVLANTIAARTRETDLDKEEKLAKADKYANDAVETLKTAPRPNPSISDADWEEGKKELTANAHVALGMSALVRGKTDAAIDHFKTSITMAPPGDPITMVRLGNALSRVGKYDEAIATLDKVIAAAQIPPNVKQIAEKEREAAVKAKGQAK
jgi:TolA-binding protein